MKKVVLFLLVVLGLALLEPRSRAEILNWIPLADAGRQQSAKRALERIGLELQRTAAQTGAYPQPDAFNQWLARVDQSAQDPWGTDYYLQLFADSFVVCSPGPDARRHTADDLRWARRRAATAAGTHPAATVDVSDLAPRPPSSGVKSRAMRKATSLKKRE